MYKNIEKQAKLRLKEPVDYRAGQAISKTLVQNEYVSMTIFSLDKGEEISAHKAGGDAMVTVLEGKGRFTVADEVFYPEAGETLIMPNERIFRSHFPSKNRFPCIFYTEGHFQEDIYMLFFKSSFS